MAGDKDEVVVESSLGAVGFGSAFGVSVSDGPDFEKEQVVRDALGMGGESGGKDLLKGLFGKVGGDVLGVDNLNEDMEAGGRFSRVSDGIREFVNVVKSVGFNEVVSVVENFSNGVGRRSFGFRVRVGGSSGSGGGGGSGAVWGDVHVKIYNLVTIGIGRG